MRKLKHLLEYVPVMILDLIIQIFPLFLAIRLGEALGLVLAMVLSKRRKLVLENLRNSFPDKADPELQKIATSMWKNLGRIAVEFIRLKTYLSDPFQDHVEWVGAGRIEEAMNQGRGVILLTSHLTNWELTGFFLQMRFGKITAIARPMKNPYVEKWVQSKRAWSGIGIIPHRQAVKASLKWLKEKMILGILVDQNLYHGGVFVNFFGRPAATTTLPALLHARTGAPVIPVYLLRVDNIRYRLVCEPPIIFPEILDDTERIRAYTQLINDRLEHVVRQYPENWFWIHNRWKRKPENEIPAVNKEAEED